MGGRYIVSGAQLGLLITLTKTDPEKANLEINKISEEQFLFDSKYILEEDKKYIIGQIKKR